jgi:tetratricopeptide (TPR) repeat protein
VGKAELCKARHFYRKMTKRIVILFILLYMALSGLVSPTPVVAEDSIGFFTERELECGEPLLETLILVQQSLSDHFEPGWYDRYYSYVAAYVNENGSADEWEAYKTIMLASVFMDNATIFYIATVDALKLDPNNPVLLNSAASVLMIMGYYELAGRVLDCAYEADPMFFHTYNTAAAWMAARGEVGKALEALRISGELYPERDHTNWEALDYAHAHNRQDAIDFFYDRLPSNYPFANSDGSCGGGGEPRQGICCSCTGKMYYWHELKKCLRECKATLRCFTGICKPALVCYKATPFNVGISLCIPPKAFLQICFGVSTDGSISLGFQANLLDLFKVGIKGSYNFSDLSSNVSVYGDGIYEPFSGGFEYNPKNGEVTVTHGHQLNKYFGISISLPVRGKGATLPQPCSLPSSSDCLCSAPAYTVHWRRP